MVGKWHLGFSTAQHTPANRCFDWSYTYWNGAIDYWTKQYGFYNDLHFGDELVTDPAELSTELHNGYLMESKAEAAIAEHAANYPDQVTHPHRPPTAPPLPPIRPPSVFIGRPPRHNS